MQAFQTKSRPVNGKAAFSLTEMLVVIAIIAILMAVGTIGTGGMGGKGVSTGVVTSEALFSEARATALGRNIRACVLVAKALTNSPESDLKRIVVAYEPLDPDTGMPSTPPGNDPAWEISSRGTMLPDQTFFSEQLSKKPNGEKIDTVTLNDTKKNYQGEYYIYEFNSQGICTTVTSASSASSGGASFVIGNGTRNLTKSAIISPPKVMASSKRDFGGFVVWRSGSTSVFRHPEQISSSLPNSGSTF